MNHSTHYPVTDQTRVRRQPKRASYERETAHAILDEALCGTLAFLDGGQPFALPLVYARRDEEVLLHCAKPSRMAQCLASGEPVCLTVAILDGIVFARSAMHHSLNYRSVVVLGCARELNERTERLDALAHLVDHVAPGRSRDTRPPNDVELGATRVFALPLEQVSVKARSGGPIDDPADLDLPYWAGVVPVSLTAAAPIADATRITIVSTPSYLQNYVRAVRAKREEDQ